MVQDVGGRDMEWRPVNSGSPWKYVDVGGYSSGGLRFRHIQSPDCSGLFAFLGHRKTTRGNTLGMVYFASASDTFQLVGFASALTRRYTRSVMSPLVAQQQAGMVDIDDFGCFRADITELELANTQRWRP